MWLLCSVSRHSVKSRHHIIWETVRITCKKTSFLNMWYISPKKNSEIRNVSVSYLRRVASHHPVCPQFPLIVSNGSFAQATQRREHGFFHFTKPFFYIASGLEAFPQANLKGNQSIDKVACVGLVSCMPSVFPWQNPKLYKRWSLTTNTETSIDIPLYIYLLSPDLLLYFTASTWSQLPERVVYMHCMEFFTYFHFPTCCYLIFVPDHFYSQVFPGPPNWKVQMTLFSSCIYFFGLPMAWLSWLFWFPSSALLLTSLYISCFPEILSSVFPLLFCTSDEQILLQEDQFRTNKMFICSHRYTTVFLLDPIP